MFDRVLRPAKDLLVSPLAAAIIGLAAAACAGTIAGALQRLFWALDNID